jgi:hypothetical protein
MAIRAGNAARGAIQSAQGALDTGLGVVAEYEEKKRKAEEAYVFNSSSLSFQKMHTEFLHNVKKTPDEQIVPDWTAATQAWRQSQLDQYGKKLSNRAMASFQQNIDSAIGGSTAKFQVVADQLGTQRREGAAVANWNEFLKTGDPAMAAKAEGALRLAVNAGDMTQDKMDFYTSQIKPVLQENQILNGIDHDPFQTLKGIKDGKYPDVPENKLSTLRNTAEKQVDYNQRTTSADLTNEFGMTNVPKTDRELQDLKKAGKITGTYVENYKKMVARSEYKDAENNQALMLNKMRDLDLSDSDNPEKDVRQITDEAASLPPQLQKEIHALGDSKLKAAKKGESTVEQPIHKTQLDLMRNTFDERQGMAKLSKADFRSKYGHAAMQPDAESERLRYAKAQKAYIDWSHTKKGAEATPEMASAERERLGFGEYKSATDVKMALKAGRLDRGLAKEILASEFGIK